MVSRFNCSAPRFHLGSQLAESEQAGLCQQSRTQDLISICIKIAIISVSAPGNHLLCQMF